MMIPTYHVWVYTGNYLWQCHWCRGFVKSEYEPDPEAFAKQNADDCKMIKRNEALGISGQVVHCHRPYRSLIQDVQEVTRPRMAYLIIGFVIGLTVGLSAHAEPLEQINNREPIVVKSTLTFSPEHTACVLAHMPKWKPIYGSTRHQIPKGSRIRWFQTIICRDFSQDPIKEFYLNQEWTR